MNQVMIIHAMKTKTCSGTCHAPIALPVPPRGVVTGLVAGVTERLPLPLPLAVSLGPRHCRIRLDRRCRGTWGRENR
jgi:hypothetical protein